MIINYKNGMSQTVYSELIESLYDDKGMTVKSFRVLERFYFALLGADWRYVLRDKTYNSLIGYFHYSDVYLTNEINEWRKWNHEIGAACICGLCRHCGTKCLGWSGSHGNRVVDVYDACWCRLENYEFVENNKLLAEINKHDNNFQLF